MAVTEPGDLVGLTYDGDVESTEVTNAMTEDEGFPLKIGEELVSVVAKQNIGSGRPEFHSAEGRVFVRNTEGFGFVEVDGSQIDVAPLQAAADAANAKIEEIKGATESVEEPTLEEQAAAGDEGAAQQIADTQIDAPDEPEAA
jgi:hypothetical protein